MIELNNLIKIYSPNIEILSNINLKIKKGEFVAIVGDSGAGKSTLLNIMGFLDKSTRGSYFLKEKR